MALLIGLLCAILAITCGVIYKTFAHTSAKELKRRARYGDEIAALLYSSVSYGLPAKLIVGGVGLLSAYGAAMLFIDAVGAWLALPLMLVIGGCGAILIGAKSGTSKTATWLAAHVAPVLVWLIESLHPLFDWLSRLAHRLFPPHIHSGLYEEEDLIALLEQQKKQQDNRIPENEIDLLMHALRFGKQTVTDVLVPKRAVKTISTGENIGPVLMDELHSSGHSRFPVYETTKDNLVGVLYMHDLVSTKQGGTVRDVMRPKLSYVHEDFTLYQMLQAFGKTKQHLFIVVNNFEEYVGIITIEDVLKRVIGTLRVDEFDQYDDPRAVALYTQKEHEGKHEPEADAQEATEDDPEVVK